jgi:AcrR family transcriptional regulator
MAGQSKIKYKKLLDKAEELFLKFGYTSVSVDQIAKEAGISKMTIYKHFHSKEELFIKVLMNITDHHTKMIIGKIDERYHTFEKIETLYAYMLEVNSLLSPILIKDIMDRASILQILVAYKEQRTLETWRRIVEDGIQKKEIRELDIDFISNLLLYMPTMFMKTNDYLDEAKRLKMFTNLFDFMKYGLLGGIESPDESSVKEEI